MRNLSSSSPLRKHLMKYQGHSSKSQSHVRVHQKSIARRSTFRSTTPQTISDDDEEISIERENSPIIISDYPSPILGQKLLTRDPLTSPPPHHRSDSMMSDASSDVVEVVIPTIPTKPRHSSKITPPPIIIPSEPTKQPISKNPSFPKASRRKPAKQSKNTIVKKNGVAHAAPVVRPKSAGTASHPKSAKRKSKAPSYVVETIWAKGVHLGKIWYLVKWANFSANTNTWEPEGNLDACPMAIKAFEEGVSAVLANVTEPLDLLLLSAEITVLPTQVNAFIDQYGLAPSQPLKSHNFVGRSIELYKSESLRAFEKLVSIDDRPPIHIVNTVDNEGPPAHFSYITRNFYGEGMPEPDPNFLHSCLCTRCSMSSAEPCTCSTDVNGHSRAYAYDAQGFLRTDFGRQAIFECNALCTCDEKCPNRIVQNGRKIRLCIIRTNKKGWGVLTLDPVKRGQFVVEYVGEVITSECAEVRARAKEYGGNNYLFDLDFGGDEFDPKSANQRQFYTIDAKHKGNVSHFLNHSCSPNLIQHAVYIESQDRAIHRIAFFAKRDIKSGEELTFDYAPQYRRKGVGTMPSPSHRKPCHCGAKSCRGWLPI